MMKIDLAKVDPQALHLMWTLYQAGFEARIAGGAVRDLVVGFPPKDWDIATTARPEQVIDVMNSWGIHTIPTGLQHGTITAVMNEDNYEITTLRADVTTDGRHAEVEFIDDWREDAARRDFTMNAMFLDSDGVVHDYFDGLTHLGQWNIQFVGDPAERIQEDYLRILRYFRFRARLENELHRISNSNNFTEAGVWNWGHRDEATKDAIRQFGSRLEDISGERIWSELRKIFQYEGRTYAAFRAMDSLGILCHIGLECLQDKSVHRVNRMANLIHGRRLSKEPAVVLASAFDLENIDDCLDVLRNRYKVSREEFAPVQFAADFMDLDRTRVNTFRLLANHPKEHVLAWIDIGRSWTETTANSLGFASSATNHCESLYRFVVDLEVPEFPVRGQDLLDRGLTPGPEVGRLLANMRCKWADLEFQANKEYLLTSEGFPNPDWNT